MIEKPIPEHITKQLVTNQPALVEAGHFYANEAFGPEHKASIALGLHVLKQLDSLGITGIPCLFIDNYNAKGSLELEEANIAIIKDQGFVPHEIFHEADMEEKAENLLSQLEQKGKVSYQQSRDIKRLKANPPQVLKEENKLNCALLDSAFYIEKFNKYKSLCITILPERLKSQQHAVKAILKVLEIKIPILDVYFDKQGIISSVDFEY